MTIKALIHEVADTLRQAPGLAGITIIEDDKGNPGTELEAAVAKTRHAVLVGWSGFTPVKQGNARGFILGDVTIVVSIFERPAVNRANGAYDIHSTAITIAKTLTYASSGNMICPLFLKDIKPVELLDKSGSVSQDIEFSTKVEL